MVIKLYISGISGNKEVKKKQQRVQMILDSKQISYEAIDITEPGKEKDKEFMQQNGKVRESLGKYPLPPQIFNDEDFCGDYEDFDMANEVDELEKFLHIETISKDVENGTKPIEDYKSINNYHSRASYDPYDYHTYKMKWDDVNGLQEEVVSTGSPKQENEKVEENVKSEINGESEAVPTTEKSESVVEKTEATSDEVPVPVKEEEAPEQEKEATNEDEEEKEEEKKNEANENEENEKEEVEQEKGTEEVETTKEESEVEKPSEEETPHEEEAEAEENVDNESKIKEESENEEEEEKEKKEEEEEEEKNDNKSESAESEKSQED